MSHGATVERANTTGDLQSARLGSQILLTALFRWQGQPVINTVATCTNIRQQADKQEVHVYLNKLTRSRSSTQELFIDTGVIPENPGCGLRLETSATHTVAAVTNVNKAINGITAVRGHWKWNVPFSVLFVCFTTLPFAINRWS